MNYSQARQRKAKTRSTKGIEKPFVVGFVHS
jgi:hypothetical protein